MRKQDAKPWMPLQHFLHLPVLLLIIYIGFVVKPSGFPGIFGHFALIPEFFRVVHMHVYRNLSLLQHVPIFLPDLVVKIRNRVFLAYVGLSLQHLDAIAAHCHETVDLAGKRFRHPPRGQGEYPSVQPSEYVYRYAALSLE